jgi:hypothetical protein
MAQVPLWFALFDTAGFDEIAVITHEAALTDAAVPPLYTRDGGRNYLTKSDIDGEV